MAIDIQEIALTNEQKRRIAQMAEQTGRPWREVLDEQFDMRAVSADAKSYGFGKYRYIEDAEKRRAHFREWLSKQTSHNPNFDDSRESIYD